MSERYEDYKPWQIRRGETQEAFAAFSTYLRLGQGRTLKDAEVKLGRTTTLSNWSREHCWRERAAQYDSWKLQKQLEAEEVAVAERAGMWERRRLDELDKAYQLAVKLRMRAEEMLSFPLREEVVNRRDREGRATHVTIKPANWNFGTAATIAKLAVEMANMTTESALAVDDGFDPLAASAEELRAYIARAQSRKQTPLQIEGPPKKPEPEPDPPQ